MTVTRLVPVLALLAAGCGGHAAATSGSTTGGSTGTPNYQLVGFETVDQGPSSPRGFNLGAHETHVATDSDWSFFWTTHSTARPPLMDFTQETAVATFMGQIGGGSHTSEIVNVSRDLNSQDVHALVREFRLGPWKPNTRNITSPFHIVRADTAVSGQGTVNVDRQQLLDSEVIQGGSNSALGAGDPTYTGGLRVVRDQAAYAALYAQIQPTQRPPAVDFNNSMVVAILAPYYGSFGHSVQLMRLVHDEASDEIRVVSRVNGYSGGAAPPPATETPFLLLRVTQATGAIREEVRASQTFARLSNGISRYMGPAERVVLHDAAAFAALWSSRVGGPVPLVDFSVNQVVAVFEPVATGRTASIARVEGWEDSEQFIQVNTMSLFGGGGTGSPYAIVSTPRTYGPSTYDVRDVTPRP